jgi:hypothetical protein
VKWFNSENVTDIWQKYEKGKDHHHKLNIYDDTDKCHRFYEGDQWHGLERDGEILPIHNFIKPVVKYKTAMIAQNAMGINYSAMNTDNQQLMAEICDKLNKFAAQKWELQKLDSIVWDIIKEANISGDAYLYFYDADLNCQMIDRKNIYFADEQQTDIQKQKYILIFERRFVDDVKKDAKANKVDEQEINNILPDDDTENLSDNGKNEVKTKDGKCSCLVMLKKKDGIVTVSRSTKTVTYQKETVIDGLDKYPIVSLVIDRKYESCRGNGEVLPLIPNQIETNRLLARRSINIQLTGFAKPVYNEDLISNPKSITQVGTAVAIRGQTVQNIRNAFDYINPAPMSPDAKQMQEELLNNTRELSGAGDSATGNIDPTKASGAAIIAVRDQAAIPLNEQIAAYRQFVEDIASVWFAMWVAYNPNGMQISYENDGEYISEVIPAEDLSQLNVHVKIDVSPTSPFSKFAREQSLENALAQQHITFEEYVEALDDDATAPKVKFEMILEKRQMQEQNQLMQIIEQQAQLLELRGGNNAMPEMQDPNGYPEYPLPNGQ